MPLMITELRGCSDLIAARLAELGIIDAPALLKSSATPKQRKILANHVEVEREVILALANRADLARIRGIAGVYADLLERSGVDTVRELATRRADKLFKRVMEVNEQESITPTPPTQRQVENWIAQAGKLPAKLTY